MVSSQHDAAMDRRTVIRGLGALAVGGALAGCSGDGGDDGGGNGGGDSTPADTETPADTPTQGSGGETVEAPAEVEDFVSDSSNYDGLVDKTGQSTVTVTVGAEGNGGAFAFGPPAVKVSSGTTVQWEWNGEGGTHNVVAEDGTFDSGSAVAEAGVHLEHTFENAGNYLYVCEPHQALGMVGAVVVE